MTFAALRLQLAVAVSLVPLALGAEEGTFDRTLTVTGPVQLEVRTGSGSIEVTAGASGSVEIHGVIRARSGFFSGTDVAEKVRRIEQNPPIEQEGNVVRVGGQAE